jgi:hypothetical protein
MNERYEDVRLAPDPARYEELRRRLHAHMSGSAPSRVVELDEEVAVSQNPIRHRSRGRVYLAAAAAVVIVGGVVGIALATADPDSGDDIEIAPTVTAPVTSPESMPTPTTAPATNAPAVTITAAPGAMSTDADIALAALLYPSEYARGATLVSNYFPTTTFDREVASGIENCKPYLDAIAAADAAPEMTRTFALQPDPQMQYAVVFPDEQVARDWFDVVTDEAFLESCAVELFDAQLALGEWLPIGEWLPVGPASDVPPLDLAGDDVWVGLGSYDLTRDDGSVVHIENLNATIRVGRMGFTIDAVYPSVLTAASFEAVVARAVERARVALEGEIAPEAPLADLPPHTDAQVADASLLTGDEFQPGFVVDESRTDAISLDADAARTIPACGPYAETIATFAGATQRTRWFTNENGSNDYAQYTVVFADEAAAIRAFDMLDDDAFVAGCAIPMQAEQGSHVPVTGTRSGRVMSWLVGGDENSPRVSGDGYIEFSIRVGRAVIVLTGGDSSVQTEGQFVTAAATQAVQKARFAFEGITLPQ